MVHCCHNGDCEWWLTGILYQKLMTRRCITFEWLLICVILERNMAHHVSLVTVDSPGEWWWWPTSDIQVKNLHIIEWPLSDVILWYRYTYQCHNNDCKVIQLECWSIDVPLIQFAHKCQTCMRMSHHCYLGEWFPYHPVSYFLRVMFEKNKYEYCWWRYKISWHWTFILKEETHILNKKEK